MNDKISKQKMYTDFSIRLDKLEYMLEKVLALMEDSKPIVNTMTIQQWSNSLAGVLAESDETIQGPPKPFIQIQDSEQFDSEYK